MTSEVFSENKANAEAGGGMSPGDLVELMNAFNEVTTKLERTHDQLRSEVVRLNAELNQANEALQRSKRLAALGEMAAGISHEIRNPLGSIRLYTRMLQDDLAGMPEQCSIVEKIGRAVTGLDQIVGDVLAFSRELKVRAVECSAAALLRDACDGCVAELAGIDVAMEIQEGCEELWCDPSLVHQALVNIVRNGAQATLDRVGVGGAMVIGVRRSAVQEGGDESGAGGYELFVRDSGGGIEAAVVERMFNPFFTTRAAGTGLGLSIVHRIMDAHGGAVRVENNAEKNTGDLGWTHDWTYGATVSLLLCGQASRRAAQVGQGEIVVRAGPMAQRVETKLNTSVIESQRVKSQVVESQIQGDVA